MSGVPAPAAPESRRPVLRLGTRASALARVQSEWVADQLRAAGHVVELVLVQTHGDASSAPLTQIGGTGVFVSALREALLRGDIDLAVHSLKDLPTAPADGLALAAVPVREDPRDVVVSRSGLTLDALPPGSRVGTGSPRRAAQLQAHWPQLRVSDLRGNVDTRIQKVHDGELDAVVLAAAGLRRLGREAEATQVLPLERMLPAPGQGALAVECRADDDTVLAALAPLDDAPTRRCVIAERDVLAELQAGCTAPVAAWAREQGEELALTGLLAQGAELHTVTVTEPLSGTVTSGTVTSGTGGGGSLGRRVGAALLARVKPGGADRRLDRPGRAGADPPAPPASRPLSSTTTRTEQHT